MLQEHNAVRFVLRVKKCFHKRTRASYPKALKLLFALLAWVLQADTRPVLHRYSRHSFYRTMTAMQTAFSLLVFQEQAEPTSLLAP